MALAFDPAVSPLFKPWRDPLTGVVSRVLVKRCAHSQQAFYFTNANVFGDGRRFWLYASDPPTPGHHLGLVDLEAGTVKSLPRTGFPAETAFVDPVSGEAFWASGRTVYRCAPRPDAEPVRVGAVPDEFIDGRDLRQISTHLTRSADGRWLNLDLKIGRSWHLAGLDLHNHGAFVLWHSSERHINHGQFSPTDPTLLMFAQDWWRDILTGQAHGWENRVWLLRPGGEPRPLYPKPKVVGAWNHCHEWWGRDGRGIWYVDYDQGTFYHDLATERRTLVWPGKQCHAHASADGRRLVGDLNTYNTRPGQPCRVTFLNRDTGREVDIVSDLPFAAPELKEYHWHPHPQFIWNDEWIAYTTTVQAGRLDFALVRVAELVDLTAATTRRPRTTKKT